MMPQDAAQRFVELVLRTTFDDVLDLADPHDGNHPANDRAQKAAYTDAETAVRRRFRVTHDLEALEKAVLLAAPKKHRADVAIALSNLLMAVADEFTVKQQAGYAVGLAVGRMLHPAASVRLGKGWKARR